MKKTFTTAISAIFLLTAGVATAAPTAAQKCQAGKNKVVGQYYACREKAVATAISKGGLPDYQKCSEKFTQKWSGAETAGGVDCPDNITVPGDLDTYITGQASDAAAIVAGTKNIPVCGDGAINATGEYCDGALLDGKTCDSFGKYGTLACTAGCEFDLSGCTSCPVGMISYQDSCWVLAAQGSDCDTACSGLSLVYDSATVTIAGSGGTDANCAALLSATGAPGGELDQPGGFCPAGGLGCGVLPASGFRARCGTPATTSSSSNVDVRRICACQ